MYFDELKEKLKKINSICEDIKADLEKELLTSECAGCGKEFKTFKNVKSFLNHGACISCMDYVKWEHIKTDEL